MLQGLSAASAVPMLHCNGPSVVQHLLEETYLKCCDASIVHWKTVKCPLQQQNGAAATTQLPADGALHGIGMVYLCA